MQDAIGVSRQATHFELTADGAGGGRPGYT